jgi:RHS repeat-associated protein
MLVNRSVYGPEIDEPVRRTRGAQHVQARNELGGGSRPAMFHPPSSIFAPCARGLRGRDRDPDTGLYNFRYRTYSLTLGRFLQVDSIGNPAFDQARRGGYASLDLGDSIEDASFGDGPSRYAFTANNPVVRVDPSGLAWNVVKCEQWCNEAVKLCSFLVRRKASEWCYGCCLAASDDRCAGVACVSATAGACTVKVKPPWKEQLAGGSP